MLAKIDADFSPAYKAAIARTPYRDSIKIGWQAPRFWEGPKYQIYGGLSFVKGPSNMVWYPSYGLHSKTGVILGAYAGGKAADELARMPRAAQIEHTRKVIEAMHPGCGRLLEKPMQVQWAAVPYNQGIGVGWASDDEPDYHLLGQPDGPIHFAGEYLQPCRRLAGRGDPRRPPRHRHAGRPAPQRTAGDGPAGDLITSNTAHPGESRDPGRLRLLAQRLVRMLDLGPDFVGMGGI